MEAKTNPAVRIISYNVLSNKLCTPSHFKFCKPGHLIPQKRLNKLKQRLETHVKQRSIICLQEVSEQWAGDLISFFYQRGYTAINTQYGSFKSGVMGVMTAFPSKTYRLETCRFEHPSQVNWRHQSDDSESAGSAGKSSWLRNPLAAAGLSRLSGPARSALRGLDAFLLPSLAGVSMLGLSPSVSPFFGISVPPSIQTLCAKALAPLSVFGTIYGLARLAGWVRSAGPPKEESLVEQLVNNKNTLLLVKLTHIASQRELWVANYHMPCKFWDPTLMLCFASLATQTVQRLAGATPYLFVGDFNSAPTGGVYQLLTTGVVPQDFTGPPPEAGKWRPHVAPMKSAYKELLGAEPECTNFAKTDFSAEDEETFAETIDYVFYGPERTWKPTHVEKIKSKAELSQAGRVVSLPDANEISDHLLVGAELELRISQ